MTNVSRSRLFPRAPSPTAFGSIYKGELRLDPRHPTLVALKVSPSTLSENEEEVRADNTPWQRASIRHPNLIDFPQILRRELQTVKSLSSRHRQKYILHFLGTARHGLQTIIVADFINNGNLLSYLGQNPRVSRQKLILQVAEAVYFLHDFVNLVHGDLKCENVLVSDEGNALLADFGLSTLVDKAESSATTATGIRLKHTVRFAAPEVLLGEDCESSADSAVSPRSKTTASDVYAFGMMVLQAFTGELPWPRLSQIAVITRVLVKRDRHPRPGTSATRLGLTDAWWTVCCDCWSFETKSRPTMFEVRNKLSEPVRLLPLSSSSLLTTTSGASVHRLSYVCARTTWSPSSQS
ncbi:kinase-like protein [Auricularia subglabra TFB-10046 SS5]|nr:kinase-like protein [Auricularia subglabra TFB-10046 SS5]